MLVEEERRPAQKPHSHSHQDRYQPHRQSRWRSRADRREGRFRRRGVLGTRGGLRRGGGSRTPRAVGAFRHCRRNFRSALGTNPGEHGLGYPYLLYLNRRGASYHSGVEFVRRAPGRPGSLAILPGSFHPPTRAHLALARAGLAHAGEVLFVLPRDFPHKRYESVGLEDRLRLVEAAIRPEEKFSLGVSEGGLFAEIARECRDAYGPETALKIMCGTDAAERFLRWDYGRPGAAAEMLREFELLVASRGTELQPPPELAARIHRISMPAQYRDDSATEVRRRIAAGEPWEHLVPESAVDLIREIYTPRLRGAGGSPERP